MQSHKRVTIRDVAAAAGVSHQTVSRVLNDRPDVAADTRARIWQIIDRLNYQPSAIARSLTRQHSLTLGIVTAGLKYAGPSRTLSGITRAAQELGYTLLLKELPDFTANNVQPLLNSLLERRVDGIAWAVPEVGNNRAWLDQQLDTLPVPMIFTTMQARPGVKVVAVDNYAGGCLAAGHLLHQGYRHIAHISGPLTWWEARQRKAGWRDALLAAGVPEEALHAEEGNWSSASGEAAFERLLARCPDVDAVFVGNDQMALGVLQAACRQGIGVPGRLAVVGFDGLSESAHYWPPLTTVYQDQRKLGSTAVYELVRDIEAGRPDRPSTEPPAAGPQSLTLYPELIVRGSSATERLGAGLLYPAEGPILSMETS
ncbi:MAG: LacI family DNA-binding transcriptional regulator [Anaerolineae bacterium]|nr:LacI family DNA-binding transcriptional regulator [Anaerolineae bacterium]